MKRCNEDGSRRRCDRKFLPKYRSISNCNAAISLHSHEGEKERERKRERGGGKEEEEKATALFGTVHNRGTIAMIKRKQEGGGND